LVKVDETNTDLMYNIWKSMLFLLFQKV